MKKRLWSTGALVLAVAAGTLGILQGPGVQAQVGNPPQPFADPAFQKVWTRTDLLVQQGQAGRSWFWGPQPRTATHEPNQELPGGSRLVQYFDKSRMEINDPNADPNGPFYVTNGLLTVELISGNMQIGANAFSPRYTACINIAGDVDDATAPTYASFRSVASVGGGIDHPQQDKRGQVATDTLDRNGNVGTNSSKSGVAAGTYVYYEPATQHNIPQVFWNFLNQQGPVMENGQVTNAQLIVPWFYASGYPISDAYWARVKVAGVYQDVLIQAYQRRVLTYNPANQPAFQVEMGNIGLHYFDWRYNNAGQCAAGTPGPGATVTATVVTTSTAVPTVTGTPALTVTPSGTVTPTATATPFPVSGKIAWMSTRSGKKDVWIMNPDGTTPINLTAGSTGDNYDPAFSPDGKKIAFATTRDNNPNKAAEIYVMNVNGSGAVRLTNNPGNDYHPTWSPDGTKIAFVSDRSGNNNIWLMNADGSNPLNITQTIGSNRDPAWADNVIAFVSNRNGSDQIYTMNPDGTAVTQLTNSTGVNWLPAWSNARQRLLFVSSRDGGNNEIYMMKLNGGSQERLTNLLSDEYDPAWSPNGQYMTYASNRDGNLEIYTSYTDGTNLRRLTNDAADDAHPTWR